MGKAKVFPIWLYLGPPGSGKSYRMREDVKSIIARMRKGQHPRQLILGFDPVGELEKITHLQLTRKAFENTEWDSYPKGTIFVFDEVDKLIPNKPMEESNLIDLLEMGRHRNYRIFANARRMVRMHQNLAAYATKVHIFRNNLPRDLQFIENMFGVDKSVVQSLPKWKPHIWRYNR